MSNVRGYEVNGRISVAIRTDASEQIGSGHVMRCLALAEALRKRSAEVFFVCREEPGHLIDVIRRQGYLVRRLPAAISGWEADARLTTGLLAQNEEIDWLIVDQYSLDRRWEQTLLHSSRKLMVIDDLANRPHVCDLLLDQNFYEGMKTRYAELVPPGCVQLLGPRYALLRTEFAEARNNLRPRDGKVERILLFFGASDRTNETIKALTAVARFRRRIAVDVVIGINNPHRNDIEKLATTVPYAVCHDRVQNMAALMNRADLYLGAAGTTTWERCCVGLPSLVITVADNQVRAAQDLAREEFLEYVGHHDTVQCDDIAAALRRVFETPDLLRQYSMRSLNLVDGLGTQRCADTLLTMPTSGLLSTSAGRGED